MAEIFPRWSNDVPRYLGAAALGFALLTAPGVWYYFSPEYSDVGYMPRQPVPFSHALHVGELKMDCRYCHASVELSPVATIPPTETCMNCHSLVSRDSDKLALVFQSIETGEPIHWIRVHKIPDYAYFNHSVHFRSGIGCFSCHGNVAEMEEIRQVEPLSMRWCLDCHRQPDEQLRPGDQVTNPAPSSVSDQIAFASGFRQQHPIDPPTDCSGCHR
ncbi:MAG: cytochrome c3 family protein [Acidobacteriota bacterium]